jgi:ribonuclease PH
LNKQGEKEAHDEEIVLTQEGKAWVTAAVEMAAVSAGDRAHELEEGRERKKYLPTMYTGRPNKISSVFHGKHSTLVCSTR